MNHFNKTFRKAVVVLVAAMLVLSLTGCGLNKRPKRYQSYIESLITANYLGISDEYLETTGANAADAEALYLENATRLAENLIAYYGLQISNDSNMGPQFVELAKNIYNQAKFEVSEAYANGNDYYVDIKISPIDIIGQADPDISAYVENFNTRVNNGEFNNYEKEDYERVFAEGVLSILQKKATGVSYADEETLTVKIIVNNDSYYISDEDFLAIDKAIVKTYTTEQ